jgi:hypothetical protein
MAKRKSSDDPKQTAAFRKAARELGCDASEKQFQDVLRAIAKAKPQAQLPKKSPHQIANRPKR